jgi:NTP pyrophosphatase (non-canonical NTP hydrolase)
MESLIKNWALTFGLEVNDSFDSDRIKGVFSSIDYKLIEEEFNELSEACKQENVKEIIDAGGDLIWVIIRLFQKLGVSTFEVMRVIYFSNMSKFDIDEKNAHITRKKYLEQGIDCRTEIIKNNDTLIFICKRNSDNKVLKSHLFKEPDFTHIINNKK